MQLSDTRSSSCFPTMRGFEVRQNPSSSGSPGEWPRFVRPVLLLLIGATIMSAAEIAISINSGSATRGGAVSFPPAEWASQPPAWID